MKSIQITRKKRGKRGFLNDFKTNKMFKKLEEYFETTVEIPRIKHGKKQSIESLINEESSNLAKYVRHENQTWIPRIVNA